MVHDSNANRPALTEAGGGGREWREAGGGCLCSPQSAKATMALSRAECEGYGGGCLGEERRRRLRWWLSSRRAREGYGGTSTCSANPLRWAFDSGDLQTWGWSVMAVEDFREIEAAWSAQGVAGASGCVESAFRGPEEISRTLRGTENAGCGTASACRCSTATAPMSSTNPNVSSSRKDSSRPAARWVFYCAQPRPDPRRLDVSPPRRRQEGGLRTARPSRGGGR